ncbi:MAG TPA: hypothetical protein VMM92_13665 [Thermoanaerobaculia bacterium]|nr:hypothetical protein [Thermoanaerobaculia bacterium]
MDLLTDELPQIPMTITFTPPEQPGGQPGWQADPPNVTIDPRVQAIIVVTLATAAGASSTATFDLTTPLAWTPPAPPKWAAGGWLGSPTLLNISITNQGPKTKGSWCFVVNVLYDNQPYASPDPTIINIEPTGTFPEILEIEELVEVIGIREVVV